LADLEDKEFIYSGGIFKSETTPDGGLNISGYATLEVPDKSNEIIDFPSTVTELQKWSDDTAQRSGGKSKGNLRVMHQLELGGKVTDMKAVKTTVKDKNGNDQEVNAVLINGYIPPSLPDVIKNVQDGILNGFSIGGKYKSKPSYDSSAGANRYTPIPSEISLVDNPCCPGADIVDAIEKAVGTPQKGTTMEDTSAQDNLVKANAVSSNDAAMAGSFEELRERIMAAIKAKFAGFNDDWDGYICATYPDKVIVYNWDSSKYFEIPYTVENEVITIGDLIPVDKIEQYVPIEAQKIIQDELKKRELQKSVFQNKEAKKVTKTKEDIQKAAKAAGLAGEALDNFVKAMTADDGETDEQKAAKAVEAEAAASKAKKVEEDKAAEDAEKAVKSDLTKAASAIGVTYDVLLQKAGKTISDDTAKHLNSMKAAAGHVVKAADTLLSGNTLPDDQLFPAGMVSPVDTSIVDECAKAAQQESLTKAIGDKLHEVGVDGLQKTVGGIIDLLKSVSNELADLKKSVQEIHDQPVQAGPISAQAVTSRFAKAENGQPAITVDELTKAMNSITNPQDREILSKAVGEPMLKNLLRGN
jgi:hypothetical protein